jgi:hypothetical protein
MSLDKLISHLRQIEQDVPNKDDLINEVRAMLRRDHPEFLDDPVNKPFTIWWKGGKREVIYGPTIEDAFSKAGYGGGAVAAVDWYDRGDVNTHQWCSVTKNWQRVVA